MQRNAAAGSSRVPPMTYSPIPGRKRNLAGTIADVSHLTWTAVVPLLLAGSLAACSKDPRQEDVPAPPAARTSSGVAIVAGSAPPGAIVTLEPTVPQDVPAPEHALVMDQFGQQFLPALIAARVGQRVEFRSSEDVLHNVRVDNIETKEPIFNVATPPFESYTHVFAAPGYYQVSCDVHPAMRANIFVASTPYAAVTDDRGTFTIPDVPAGSYRLRLVGVDAPVERVVDIAAPRTELALAAADRRTQ